MLPSWNKDFIIIIIIMLVIRSPEVMYDLTYVKLRYKSRCLQKCTKSWFRVIWKIRTYEYFCCVGSLTGVYSYYIPISKFCYCILAVLGLNLKA